MWQNQPQAGAQKNTDIYTACDQWTKVAKLDLDFLHLPPPNIKKNFPPQLLTNTAAFRVLRGILSVRTPVLDQSGQVDFGQLCWAKVAKSLLGFFTAKKTLLDQSG